MIATFHLYTYVIAAFYYFQYNKTLYAHDIRPFPCVFPLARSLMNDAPDIKKKTPRENSPQYVLFIIVPNTFRQWNIQETNKACVI